MDGESRFSSLRSVRSTGILVLALIVLLGVGGYLLTSTTIRRDRDEDATRRARVEAVHTQEVLGRARAYLDGLAAVLAREPEPGQAQFARWAGATSASVGLNDVMWVEQVPGSERGRYERRRGVQIKRLTPSGRLVPAPARSYYLPATYTSGKRPELRPGVDVSGFPALATAIRDRARIFAVGASRPGALGAEPGFFLLESAGFARGPGNRGYLVAFVPRGWFSTTLGGDPRRFAISEDGRRIEGQLDSVQASAAFEMLGRNWRIDAGREPLSGLQSMLPWLALAWPFAVAGIVLAIGRAIMVRRRLETDVAERAAELARSEAYLVEAQKLTRTGSVALDVPTWEASHSSAEHSRLYGFDPDEEAPSLDDLSARIHPDDRSIPSEAFARGVRERTAVEAEYRVVLPNSEERRLLAVAHPVVGATGRIDQIMCTVMDVTERRKVESELERLAREQAALRRVATLVAREAPQAEVFTAIGVEILQLFGDSVFYMFRYEDEHTVVVVASAGLAEHVFPVGSRHELGGENAATRVFNTGEPVRIDDYHVTASGPIAEAVRPTNTRAVVGTPLVIDGRLWGVMVVGTTREEHLPPETELRLGQFTELMATAIANTESHARADRLADEQAALRRVATLAAEGAPPRAVLDAVAAEMEALLGSDQVALNRFEPGDEIMVLAHRGLDVDRTPVGSRVSIEGESATAKVRRTGRPARMEHYESAEGPLAELARETGLRSSVSTPITVEGRPWGLITASWKGEESPPRDTEERMAKFAGLLDTAIANAEARTEVERLADEQAALRRVATLVARESPPAEVFAAVAEEVARLLGVEDTTIFRYEDDWTATVVADRGERDVPMPIGSRVSLEGDSATALVRRTGRAARIDDFSGATGPLADYTREANIGSTVGSPIVVDGRLWGAMIAATRTDEAMPADTESRIEEFTELVATAISNMQARSELAASRARIVEAADEERRRVVRDLHDGAQQRLVQAIVNLKLAQRAFHNGDGEAEEFVCEALELAEDGNAELRELAHGILPAALTRGGLRPAFDALVGRLDLPIRVDVTEERLSAEIEASAYFVVAESLTNVVKHSQAENAEVTACVRDGVLCLEIRDDGIGGADPNGSGLVGIEDRVRALGGRLSIKSPAGGGTVVAATVPLATR
jgi:signal transduction histidine kinase/PAS domain-containing protein